MKPRTRKTLTLDDDVSATLKRLREVSGASYKKLVNDALRLGLKQMEARPRQPRTPICTRSVSLGACWTGSLDDVADALATAEGESLR
jgi:hypothetical protein